MKRSLAQLEPPSTGRGTFHGGNDKEVSSVIVVKIRGSHDKALPSFVSVYSIAEDEKFHVSFSLLFRSFVPARAICTTFRQKGGLDRMMTLNSRGHLISDCSEITDAFWPELDNSQKRNTIYHYLVQDPRGEVGQNTLMMYLVTASDQL